MNLNTHSQETFSKLEIGENFLFLIMSTKNIEQILYLVMK